MHTLLARAARPLGVAALTLGLLGVAPALAAAHPWHHHCNHHSCGNDDGNDDGVVVTPTVPTTTPDDDEDDEPPSSSVPVPRPTVPKPPTTAPPSTDSGPDGGRDPGTVYQDLGDIGSDHDQNRSADNPPITVPGPKTAPRTPRTAAKAPTATAPTTSPSPKPKPKHTPTTAVPPTTAHTAAAPAPRTEALPVPTSTVGAAQYAAAGGGFAGMIVVAGAAGVVSHRGARAGRARVNAARSEFLSPR